MQACSERDTGYLEYRIAAEKLTVRMNIGAAGRLGAAVMEGFKAVPRRGLEVGGLLLGCIQENCVLIDDFSPIDSEHRYGPSWLLSEKDKTVLGEEISRVLAEEDGPRVVGYYRSHTRPDFAPTAEDQALVADHCPDEASVFLLLKPQALGPVAGAWFAAGLGLWDRPAEFSLPRGGAPAPPREPDAHQCNTGHSEIMHLRLAKVLEAAAAREAEIVLPQPKPARRRLWLVPVAILFLSAFAGYLIAAWWTTRPRPAAPAPLGVGLRVTLDNGFLHLGWDRAAPSVRSAAGGIVWIEDGGRQRRIDLKPADLTEGSIQYWPSSSEVRFKLELLTSQGITESVRAAGIPVLNAADRQPPPLTRVSFEALKPRRPPARFASARPLRPVIPPDPAGPRHGEVFVRVQVEIDPAGKVARADLLSRPSPSTRELENAALRSARLWTFSPARSGERRIAGKGILHFTFGNPVPAHADTPAPGDNSVHKP